MRISSTATFTFSLILCLARSEDHHKRAPSGFTGVRGKKSIVENAKNAIFFEEDSDEDDANKVATNQAPLPVASLQYPSGLVGDIDKRAPSMGFVGMRGKKPWSLDPRFYVEDSERLPKRAPNGFFGMRGKKGDDSDSVYDMEKRMSSGFFGMRGKKDDDLAEASLYMSGKRAPSMGFVGMRGKKRWGPFELRGKKIPYQFRGKFVGVRGKKTSYDSGNVETEPYLDSDMNRLLMQLLEDEEMRRTEADEV